MHCPKCSAAFEKVATSDGIVDRCTGCHGLWFDMLEHEDLKRHADVIDTGDPATGAGFNEMRTVACPVCPRSNMIRMVDATQPHIWFESCSVCYGRFYDAGEYRDLSRLTLSDLFKRFGLRARE
jgi:Zn-finger nucleic acid-binding protein